MRCIALLLFVIPACAAPGYEITMNPQVAVALAGQDPAGVDPNGPPVHIETHWYDRSVAIQVDRGADGSHFVDILATADAGKALEARKSDNANVAALIQAVQSLAAAASVAAPTP